MKNLLFLSLLLLLFTITGCKYENVYDRFFDTTNPVPVSSDGLIVHLTFDGEITDISGSNTSITLHGDATYVKGVDLVDSSALNLSGFPQCLSISNFGNHDTLSVFMWFKANDMFDGNHPVTLFDYGVNSFAVQLDGLTGETKLTTKHNSKANTLPQWINSYHIWNYIYAEVGGGKMKIIYKGALLNKEPIDIDAENESPGILMPVTDLLYIGRSASGENVQNSYFKGNIDNLRVYNRPLTKSEVLSLINEDLTN